MTDSRADILQQLADLLDVSAERPPPKKAGLDGRKGMARRMILSLIDDVLRLDGGMEGADWTPADVAMLKGKAMRALDALNNVD